MDDKEMQKFNMIAAMATYGGSFVKTLAEAVRRANAQNYAKLEQTFPEYFNTYKRMGEEKPQTVDIIDQQRKEASPDTNRLDWLERNLLHISSAKATNTAYMGGERIFGQLFNEARGSGAGPSLLIIKHATIRKAIDDAMNWKNK